MKPIKFIDMCIIGMIVLFAGCNARGNGSASVNDRKLLIQTEQVISGLNGPLAITNAADGTGRLFIAEQGGTIRILVNGVLVTDPFLDISGRISCCGERGLLGIAFPPDYKSKRYFYVNYTNTQGNTVISRFHVPLQSLDTADQNSEEIILTIAQPFSNHNGGHLTFGPDGYLYIGTGDGGSGGDPFNNAQSTGTLLGKMLRIDVESGSSPYAIPSDNPFVGNASYRPEIWAVGLRNPWRYSFDQTEGHLFIADVGQDDYEEINFQSAQRSGGNYGWNIMEGAHCYNATTCNGSGLVIPIAEYDHDLGCSVTGGKVYRGSSYPDLAGIYFYGDFCSGRIWRLARSGDQWTDTLLMDTTFMISAFGEDEQGTIYLADYKTGSIHRIVPLQ
jgi:glucose/arabinose dehydrogenase